MFSHSCGPDSVPPVYSFRRQWWRRVVCKAPNRSEWMARIVLLIIMRAYKIAVYLLRWRNYLGSWCPGQKQ